jgi:thiol:disulfide interchange protein
MVAGNPDDSSRGVSPWWALLIVPVAAGIGWLAGQAPVSTSPPAVSPGEAVSAAVDRGPTPSTYQAKETASSDPTPEFSAWTSFDEAVSESRRNGKPILIDFNAEWCGPCQSLRRDVFDDAELGRQVQMEVIPVSIVDRQREEGRNPPQTEELQQRYGVDAFPTLIVFSPATGRSRKARGYAGSQMISGWITDAARAVR